MPYSTWQWGVLPLQSEPAEATPAPSQDRDWWIHGSMDPDLSQKSFTRFKGIYNGEESHTIIMIIWFTQNNDMIQYSFRLLNLLVTHDFLERSVMFRYRRLVPMKLLLANQSTKQPPGISSHPFLRTWCSVLPGNCPNPVLVPRDTFSRPQKRRWSHATGLERGSAAGHLWDIVWYDVT